MFFDNADIKTMTEEIEGKDLQVGDGVILLISDINYIHHFDEYSGPISFVRRTAVFTNGKRCSITDTKYKILKRM